MRIKWSTWQDITYAAVALGVSYSGDGNNLTGASYTVNSDLVQTVRFRTLSNSGVESYPTAPVTIKVDKTAPDETGVTVLKNSSYIIPDSGTWYNTGHVRLTVTQDTGWAPVSAEYSLDGADYEPLTNDIQDIELTPGVHAITVRTFDEAGNLSASGLSGQTFTILIDNGVPQLTVNAAVGEESYTGGYTNEQVTYYIESVSTAPFLKFEVYRNNTLVDTLTVLNGKADLVKPAALGGAYTATAAYQLPRTDVDNAEYKVVAYTTDIDNGTGEFGSAVKSGLIFNYDATAPRFNYSDVSYKNVNDGLLAVLAHNLSFGIFFNKAVVVSVQVDNSGDGTALGSGRSFFKYKLGNGAEQDASITEGPGNTYTASFEVAPQFKGDIVMRAADTIAFGSIIKAP